MQNKTVLAGALGLAALGVLTASTAATAGHVSTWVAGSNRAATGATLVSVDGVPAEHDTANHRVSVELKDVHGKLAALVTISALPRGGNLVTIRASNLTPGFHAIHIHAVGVCDPAGAKPFASAGGHFNSTGKPEGMQAGAFPVLLAGADGEATTQFVDGNFMIKDLFGATGSAIVMHAAPDNYANIPPRYAANGVAGPDAETQMTGDAGTRVACGVIASPKPAPSASASSSRSGQHW